MKHDTKGKINSDRYQSASPIRYHQAIKRSQEQEEEQKKQKSKTHTDMASIVFYYLFNKSANLKDLNENNKTVINESIMILKDCWSAFVGKIPSYSTKKVGYQTNCHFSFEYLLFSYILLSLLKVFNNSHFTTFKVFFFWFHQNDLCIFPELIEEYTMIIVAFISSR